MKATEREVLLYMSRKSLKPNTQVIPIKTNRELTIEMSMVKIMYRKKQMYILWVYRTPGGNLEEALNLLSDTIEETNAENHSILVLEDSPYLLHESHPHLQHL